MISLKNPSIVEEQSEKEELFSKRVRAGKRTYFFDVKSTRANDYYLTITESKRRIKEDGFVYEKHKIFLYKEDFEKFAEALRDTLDHIKHDLMPDVDFSQFDREEYVAGNSDRFESTASANAVDSMNAVDAAVTETVADDEPSELKWE